MAEIIDGKLVSAEVRKTIASEVADFEARFNYVPGLAVIIVGENPASVVYVRNKHKACGEVGIKSFEIKLPATATEEEKTEENE